MTVRLGHQHQRPLFFVEIGKTDRRNATHIQWLPRHTTVFAHQSVIISFFLCSRVKMCLSQIPHAELLACCLVQHHGQTVATIGMLHGLPLSHPYPEKAESLIRNLHECHSVLLRHLIDLPCGPFVLGQHIDIQPGETVENVHRHGKGVRDACPLFFDELLRQVKKDAIEIIIGPVPVRHHKTVLLGISMQAQYVFAVEAKVGMHHAGNLPLHAQRHKEQERTDQALHHQQPGMRMSTVRPPFKHATASPPHLPYGISHSRTDHHTGRGRHSDKDYLGMGEIARHVAPPDRPFHGHARQQKSYQQHRKNRRVHPSDILSPGSSQTIPQGILAGPPEKYGSIDRQKVDNASQPQQQGDTRERQRIEISLQERTAKTQFRHAQGDVH